MQRIQKVPEISEKFLTTGVGIAFTIVNMSADAKAEQNEYVKKNLVL